MQLFANNADSLLDGAIAPDSGSISLKAGDGAKFPSPTGGDYFLATLFQKVGTTEYNYEIVKVTARVGDVLTVVRAQEGTTAQAYSDGDRFELRVTAAAFQNLVNDKVDKVAGKGLSTEDYSTTEKAKLAGIATGATANSSDATLLDRANHTGTQLASTISDFAATVRTTVLTGLSTATNAAITAADTVLAALGKLQAQITGHTGASSGAHAASAIANTPAGNIAATTVQAAINELDSEKQATLVSGTNIKTAGGQSLVGSGDAPIVAPETHAATSKATPVDADELPLSDSAASWALKKLTFANLKAWITGLFVPRTGGSFGGGTDRGLVTFASAFGDGGSAANIALSAPGTAQGQKAGVAFYPTFTGTGDNGPRRAADIWASFNGNWSGERLSFGVGRGGVANDSQLATLETLALTAAGGVLAVRGGLGYGTGAGGTVTQPTDKGTSVTLNRPSGYITTFAGSIAANSFAAFQVSNNTVGDGDTVTANLVGGVASGASYMIDAQAPGAGSFYIIVRNVTGAATPSGDQPTIQFNVHKGSRS